MGAVGDDQSASDDALIWVAVEIANWAIGMPRDGGKLIERVTCDREAEEVDFVTEALRDGGFGEGEIGKFWRLIFEEGTVG